MLAEVAGIKSSEDLRLDLLVVSPVAAQEPEVMEWARIRFTAPSGFYVLPNLPDRCSVSSEEYVVLNTAEGGAHSQSQPARGTERLGRRGLGSGAVFCD